MVKRASRALFAFSLTSLLASACSSTDTQPEPTPSGTDAAVDAPSRDASVDSQPPPDAPSPSIPPAGECRFEVDGVKFASAAGDIFTLATYDSGDVNVQCVSIVGDTRHTINLAAKANGPGQSMPGVGQYSTQPATGGSPTSYRTFSAVLSLSAASATGVAGTTTFSTNGPTSKSVSVAFNLTPK